MDFSKYDILKLENKLQQKLTPERYLHTLGVAYLASALAMYHGISQKDALVAGLLHDCAKHYKDEELLSKCAEHGIFLTDAEKELPQLLHAAYGAWLAEKEYGITEESILLAIRNHTIGRTAMSLLEQIVFIADYLEPERTQPTNPSLDELRHLAFHDIDKATYLILQNTIQYLEGTGQKINPETYEVYRYYEQKIKE